MSGFLTPDPADRAAVAGFVLAGSGAGLLVAVSVGAFAGLVAGPGLLVPGLALVAAGLLLDRRSGRVPGGGRWDVVAIVAALGAFPLAGAVLGWPEVLPLLWPPALIVIYAQGRRLETAAGPLLRSPLHLPLHIVGALAEGVGLLALLAPLTLGGVPEWVGGALVALVAVRVLVWMAYRRRIAAGGASPALVAALLAFSTPFALGGTVAPLALSVLGGMAPDLTAAALAAAGLAVAAGGWALRGMLLTRSF